MTIEEKDGEFPCTLALSIPFPSAHLATTASQALAVDQELSPLVRRTFTSADNVLRVDYSATTSRMLRVAVNGFFESIGVVIGVMKDLDVDVMTQDMVNEDERSIAGTQGLEEIKG